MNKTHRNPAFFIVLAVVGVGLGSCLDEASKRLPCDPFSSQDQLKWFAGEVGDTLSFRDQNNVSKSFEIEDKYIIHTTSFVSQVGCNCHDVWGILLVNGADSIGVVGQHVYNQYEEFRLSNLNIKVDGRLTAFNSTHRTNLATYRLGDMEFRNVIRFQHNHTDSLQFRAIFIAPEIGIVRMDRVNGEIWINTHLGRILPSDLPTFRYTERVCE